MLVLLPVGIATAATTSLTISERPLPRSLLLSSSPVITNSDTLRLDTILLERGRDYEIDYQSARLTFNLPDTITFDSLHIHFATLPAWLQSWYGRDIPEITPGGKAPSIPVETGHTLGSQSTRAAGLSLSGTNSFRFSARSEGPSEFSQALSLTVTGELAPGVELTGAITDRGFDPAYGTLNSRLNELDRVNIQLRSSRVLAQLGNITVSGLPNQEPNKEVNGASATVRFPNWFSSATVARPRGRFESVRLSGSDGYQGPYQITTPAAGQAIVPNSEQVWLDGDRLERGANKDYTMDYPTGRITFNVNHPIDARSRIEIDFEPLTSEYEGELLAASGGAHVSDSLVYFSVGVAREGDDRDQPETGELSETELERLESSGDSPATISGVSVDSTGDYSLDPAFLPDSVYQFVGDGVGEFSVTFSYVGAGQGGYRFLGNGVYDYVGPMSADYEPVIILTPPERTEHVQAIVGSRTEWLGTLQADIRQTRYDRNLYSSLDDADNDGLYYDLSAVRPWRGRGGTNTLAIRSRYREPEFQTRQRLNPVDFERRYLLPDSGSFETIERWHRAELEITPLRLIRITGGGSWLEHENAFSSKAIDVRTDFRLQDRLTAVIRGQATEASLAQPADTLSGNGNSTAYSLSADYRIWKQAIVGGSFEHDRREREYYQRGRGTKYDTWRLETRTPTEYVRWERHLEDSLLVDSNTASEPAWAPALTRDRLTAGTNRQLGRLDYDLSFTYQWLDLPSFGSRAQSEENTFLGRLNLRYSNPRRRLQVASSYLVSEEVRNQRGLSYLEVDPGQGNFSFEDGRYVPDPDGNFIRVEELLSDQARVRRGEKSFYLSWDLKAIVVRVNADIDEELLPDGNRSALWALPFFSDADQPYLFFNRRYTGDFKLLPIDGLHLVNILVSEDLERRQVVDQSRQRRDRDGRVTFRERIEDTYLEQGIEGFQFQRDDYFAGAGDVEGYRVTLGVRQVIERGELSGAVAYRRASDENDNTSDIYSLTGGTRLRVVEQGELRTTLEYYRQQLTAPAESVSYQLTDNKPGEQGINWSVTVNYGLRSGLRLNFSLSGRHADTRSARITGRGEVVASL